MKISKEETRARRAVAPRKEKSKKKNLIPVLMRRRIQEISSKVLTLIKTDQNLGYSDYEIFVFMVSTMQLLNEYGETGMNEMIKTYLEQPEMIQVKDNFGVEYDYWVKTKKIF